LDAKKRKRRIRIFWISFTWFFGYLENKVIFILLLISIKCKWKKKKDFFFFFSFYIFVFV
jgi:hypothetical protein